MNRLTLSLCTWHLLTFLLSNSCQYDPHSFEYTTKKPVQSIIGVYSPTRMTLDLIKQKQYLPKQSFIELCSDSSFVFRDVPDMWNLFNQSKGGFDSGSGKWNVEKHQEWWVVRLVFDSGKDFNSEKFDGKFGAEAIIIGEKQPYTLNLTIGDPDSGQALHYQQK